MSYLTYFTVIVKEDPKEQKGQLITDIRKLRKNRNIIEGTAFEDTWYTCLTDMPNLSGKYPEMSIILYGEGEARDDNWVAYFKNGKGKKIKAEQDGKPLEVTYRGDNAYFSFCPFGGTIAIR